MEFYNTYVIKKYVYTVGENLTQKARGQCFHDINCLDEYQKECITPIYEQTVKYNNALSGEGTRNFSCMHYDTCLDGVIVRLEEKRKLKKRYKKTKREWETWHCPKDCNDFEEY
jgi:hypothetical protein